MRKNQTVAPDTACAIGIGPCVFEPRSAPAQAQHLREQLREHLRDFIVRAGDGRLPVTVPAPAGDGVPRGDGHFHLAPELFLQVSGWTRFRFPHGEQLLPAGQALLIPARLLHAERVGADDTGEPFCNLVVQSDGQALTCHIAHEAAPGRPGILHLEASRHAQAARILDWLRDAASLGGGTTADTGWATAQARALVAAAVTGVMRALDEADPATSAEPALVARVRVLVQNQLGDPALSVRRLAAQCGCTPDYLSHLFGRSAGEHLAGYIVRQRLERAAHLLAESGMAGKEVAWACGFATQSYFSRSFRTHYGATPKVWRAARRSAVA
jgi:AraC-like DNA-binding protein